METKYIAHTWTTIPESELEKRVMALAVEQSMPTYSGKRITWHWVGAPAKTDTPCFVGKIEDGSVVTCAVIVEDHDPVRVLLDPLTQGDQDTWGRVGSFHSDRNTQEWNDPNGPYSDLEC